MTPGTICERLNDIPAGTRGFWRDITFAAPSNFIVTATGAVVTAATAPTVVASGVSVDDAETFLLRFVVPMDYAADERDSDGLKLRLQCSAATSGTLSVGTAFNRYRNGGTAAGVSTNWMTAPGAKTVDNVTNEWVEFDLSGSNLLPGDIVEVTVTGTNSSTDEIVIKGGVWRYRSMIVGYYDVDKFATDVNTT